MNALLGKLAKFATVPAIFAVGAGAARLSLSNVPRRFAADLAAPFPIVTAWGAAGWTAFGMLALTIVAATAALVCIVRPRATAKDSAGDDGAFVIVAAALSIAFAFAWPYAFSSDVYAYAAYGAMVRDGLDPYALLPASVHGAFYEAARWQWSGTYPVCVYGPLSVGIATIAVAGFGAHGVASTLLALRIATAGAFLASIGFLRIVARDRPAGFRRVALGAYGLNPVILWSVAEGHNDAWLLLGATASLALARKRPVPGAFALGLSLLLKAPGAAFALAAMADPRLRAGRSRLRFVAPSLALGVLCGAALWLPLMRPAFAAIGAHGTYAPAVSLQGLTGPIPAVLIAAAAALFGLGRLVRGARSGYAWLGIAISVGLPNGYPWYALWLVPFALAGAPSRASTALWAATITSLVRYLPDAVGHLDPAAGRIAAVVAIVPLLYAVSDLKPAHLPEKVSADREPRDDLARIERRSRDRPDEPAAVSLGDRNGPA